MLIGSVLFTLFCCFCIFMQVLMKMKSVGVVDGGLFTESYCNICNAQLISESQRTAHYEVSLSLRFQTYLSKELNLGCTETKSVATIIDLSSNSCNVSYILHLLYLYQFVFVPFNTLLIHYT